MTHLLYRCYAKVNLSLEIVSKRPDGFHDLSSLVHTISLADDLRIDPADELLTRVEGLDIEPETNLVWRAAQLLARRTGVRLGAELTLVKRIPAAAGLGGGSSDAAAALIGLNKLWGRPVRLEDLQAMAAELGSDVPFFLRGGAALMQGRGDELSALRALHGQWLALLVPPHNIVDKTRRLYAALEPVDFSDGAATTRSAVRLQGREPLEEEELVNDFERAARAIFPNLSGVWKKAEERCGKRFHLSGAGPALFALARDRADAQRAAKHIAELGQASAVRTVKHARASIAVSG